MSTVFFLKPFWDVASILISFFQWLLLSLFSLKAVRSLILYFIGSILRTFFIINFLYYFKFKSPIIYSLFFIISYFELGSIKKSF